MESIPSAPKKKHRFWKIFFITLAAVLLLAVLAFILFVFLSPDATTEDATAEASNPHSQAEMQTSSGEGWTLMLYMCGTDLESEHCMATLNLLECLERTLPENVRLLVCTGGTESWALDFIDTSYIEYYRLGDENEYTLLEQMPSASMGNPATLGNFLRYGVQNYPADRYGAIIWNHGGGMNGVAFDELYDGDPLTTAELAEAFDYCGMHMEMIGFDACLMATLECAIALSPYASYMVASEEIEPGTGWDFTALLAAIAKTAISTARRLARSFATAIMKSAESMRIAPPSL